MDVQKLQIIPIGKNEITVKCGCGRIATFVVVTGTNGVEFTGNAICTYCIARKFNELMA